MADGGEPRREHPAAVVLRSAVKHTPSAQQRRAHVGHRLWATYNLLVVSTASHTGLMMWEESPLEDFKFPGACGRAEV